MTVRDDTREALARCRADLSVLIYIARCDGVFHQKERDLVDEYLARKCSDLNFDPVTIYRSICRTYPDDVEFEDALAELANYPRTRMPLVARACERLIAIDGEKTPEELQSLDRVSSYLS